MNTSNFRWKVYFNKNEKNEDITTTTMNFNWNRKIRLKNANITLTYHDELKNLIIVVKRLINYCEKTIDARNKVYKVYFDSQTLLNIIYVILIMFD